MSVMNSMRSAGSNVRGLTRSEMRSIAGMAAFIVALHVIGWGTLAFIIAPQHYALGDDGTGKAQFFGIGLGITAYTLGMRHAFDADHIAAIDNTTRKLRGEGQRPVSVGFWFSLGHSSVVFGLCLLLALGIKALSRTATTEGTTLNTILGTFGTTVSGVFLWAIGIINLIALIGIIKVWRSRTSGELDEAALEAHLNSRGFLARILKPMLNAVKKPIQMYPVGLLFGLGFDTATEISLLVLAGGAAASALPWYAILTLPILFAAGMSLFDALDGIFMSKAYGWAFTKPLRRLYYNATVTSVSIVVALIIGTIELCGVIADRFDITSGPVASLGSIELDNVGFVIVGIFIGTWVLALAAWHVFRLDEHELA